MFGICDMTTNNKLFVTLSLLIAVDCVLTTFAVGCLGFAEPNPLFVFCGGFDTFMIVKVVVSLFCLVSMYVILGTAPRLASFLMSFLCVAYGIVVVGGAVVIGLELI